VCCDICCIYGAGGEGLRSHSNRETRFIDKSEVEAAEVRKVTMDSLIYSEHDKCG